MGSGCLNSLSDSGTDLNPFCASALSPAASVLVSVLEEARGTLEEPKSEEAPRRKSCIVDGQGGDGCLEPTAAALVVV